MISENEKYRKVLNILQQSGPKLKGMETIEENIIREIRKAGNRQRSFQDLIESLFSWIYIGWVRRSLVTASVLLVMFFVYQQTMILRGVNTINKRTIISEKEIFQISNDEIDKQLMMLKLTGRKISASELRISGKKLEQLIDSYNDLQEKYRDLVKIIEEDPALKAYIEKKLYEVRNIKPNL